MASAFLLNGERAVQHCHHMDVMVISKVVVQQLHVSLHDCNDTLPGALEAQSRVQQHCGTGDRWQMETFLPPGTGWEIHALWD